MSITKTWHRDTKRANAVLLSHNFELPSFLLVADFWFHTTVIRNILENVPSELEKTVYSLLLDGMFCKCLLGPPSLTRSLDVSLLILSLEDLSFVETGVLNSLSVIALLFLPSGLLAFAYLLNFFRCSYVRCINIHTCHILYWVTLFFIDPFYLLWQSLAKVYFVWCKYRYLYFFWFPWTCSIFFHPFTFSLCVSLKLIRNFPGGPVVKNPPANTGDTGLISGLGRSHVPWSN